MTGPNKGNGKAFRWVEAHVAHDSEDCLRWPFCIDKRHGRGRLGHDGKMYWAHRFMCERAHGQQPSPLHEVAHSCGKGHEGCVNPMHLSWKTRSENGHERRQHGTAATNRTGWRGKLTKAQIAEIRALKGTMPVVAIAEKFGVSARTIDYWSGGLREKRGHVFDDFDGNIYKRKREKAALRNTSVAFHRP